MKAERSLRLWADGILTVEALLQAQVDKTSKLGLTTLLNSKGVETTGHAAFSGPAWGKQTLEFMVSIARIPPAEMDEIIEAATQYIKNGRNSGGDQPPDENNPRTQIVDGFGSESEDEGIVITGWGRVVDLRSSSPLLVVEVESADPPRKPQTQLAKPSASTAASTSKRKPETQPTKPMPTTTATTSKKSKSQLAKPVASTPALALERPSDIQPTKPKATTTTATSRKPSDTQPTKPKAAMTATTSKKLSDTQPTKPKAVMTATTSKKKAETQVTKPTASVATTKSSLATTSKPATKAAPKLSKSKSGSTDKEPTSKQAPKSRE